MRGRWAALVLFGGLGLASGPALSRTTGDRLSTASPPPRVGPQAPETIEGRVVAYSFTSKGLLDGLRLDDGTHVQFAPRTVDQVADVVVPGTDVRVSGREAGAEGTERTFEAQAITSNQGQLVLGTTAASEAPTAPTGGHR